MLLLFRHLKVQKMIHLVLRGTTDLSALCFSYVLVYCQVEQLFGARSHLPCISPFLTGYGNVITFPPFTIDLCSRHKVLTLGIYHNCFPCLINTCGLSSLSVFRSFLSSCFFHISSNPSTCKTLFRRDYMILFGFCNHFEEVATYSRN